MVKFECGLQFFFFFFFFFFVPEGTMPGPLLFSPYNNDISTDIDSEIRPFLDCYVCYREIRDVR